VRALRYSAEIGNRELNITAIIGHCALVAAREAIRKAARANVR
jgi:hypothetical protein